MKKYKLLSFSLLILVILSIITFHSVMNLIEIITPPSDMWARHSPVGVTDFRKSPSVNTAGNNLIIIYAEGEGFHKMVVDSTGIAVDSRIILIEDYLPERLVKYQSVGDMIFWTENYDLYYADLKADKPSKKMLIEGVLDYQLVGNGSKTFIAAVEKDALSLYSFSGDSISKVSEDISFENISYVAASKDKDDIVYITGVSSDSPTEFGLRLFSYEDGTEKLRERIIPFTIKNITTSREGSNSLNNLQVGLDDKDIYIFYELGKSSSQGVVARTFMGRIPKTSENIVTADFKRLGLDDDAEDSDTYISSLECLKEVSDQIEAVFITPVRTSVKKEGTELVFIKIDQGQIIDKHIASSTGEWNRFASINKVRNGYMASFLQTMGGTKYTINVTGTTESFKDNHNRITLEDMKRSLMDTAGGYVFAFFPIFVNLLIMSPVLLWPIAVDFFEWKTFFRNPLLTLNIGVAAELIVMYFSIRRIYSNTTALEFMPELIKHPAVPLTVLFLTGLTAYAFIRIYRKSKKDFGSFPELALYMLIHNIIVYFLYSEYIAGF